MVDAIRNSGLECLAKKEGQPLGHGVKRVGILSHADKIVPCADNMQTYHLHMSVARWVPCLRDTFLTVVMSEGG